MKYVIFLGLLNLAGKNAFPWDVLTAVAVGLFCVEVISCVVAAVKEVHGIN
jgi:hypothetical protein